MISIISFFYNSPILEATQMSNNGQTLKYIMIYLLDGILYSLHKSIITQASIDR